MNDMQEYLVTEFIEEYEDGNLSHEDLEHRIVGILGEAEASAVLADVPVRTFVPRRRVPVPAPVLGGAGIDTQDVSIPIDGGTLLGYLHIKDALESDDDKRSRVIEDKWIRPFASVHPGDLLHDALESLQVKGAHMARVVERDWHAIGRWHLDARGRCLDCGTALPGVFDGPPGRWGRKRQPVRLGRAHPPD